ncbi:MAG: acyl-CoA synthetase [Alphaproteobacteria bacterium]|nr:acyl-CoA synthetase [Alphaproteobacteria bacterium]
MAKPKARGKAAPPPAAAKKGGGTMVLMLMAALAVPFSIPSIIVLFFSMLPTAVAALVERPPGRFAWLAVGGLNFAAVAPSLFGMWFGNHTVAAALTVLTDVTNLLMFYGAAAIGWTLYASMPSLTGVFLALGAQRRAGVLRDQQRKMLDLWGEDVAHLEE